MLARKWSAAATFRYVVKPWLTTGDAAVGRQRGDLDRLGESAAAGQVDLDDVDLARRP